MVVNAETRPDGILGEGIQTLDITTAQDLGTDLRLL